MTTILFWTPDREKILRELWDKGISASEIGRRIKVSKNAVIGKARRMRLQSRGTKPYVVVRKKPEPPPPPPPPKLPPEKVPELKTVIEAVMGVGRNTCRWPYGEPYQNKLAFCGEPTFEKYPYCLRHCYHSYANFEEIQAKKAEKNEHRR